MSTARVFRLDTPTMDAALFDAEHASAWRGKGVARSPHVPAPTPAPAPVVADAPRSIVDDAADAMARRHADAWKPRATRAEDEPKADALLPGESIVDAAARRMAERHARAWMPKG